MNAFGAMSADTVDKDVQEWERIEAAVAFKKPDGDEILIVRHVMCPDCGHVYVMGLADGDTVSYARRHPSCSVNNNAQGLEFEDGDE